MKPMIWAGMAMVLAGCAVQPQPGRDVFQTYCVGCHGRGGAGDGAYGADLPVPPANLTMLTAGNGGVFPRERVITKIHGYPDSFHASIMPEFGSLLAGETVLVMTDQGEVSTPKALAELVAYLESIQAG